MENFSLNRISSKIAGPCRIINAHEQKQVHLSEYQSEYLHSKMYQKQELIFS